MSEQELSELGRLKALVSLLTKHNKDLLFKSGQHQSEIDERDEKINKYSKENELLRHQLDKIEKFNKKHKKLMKEHKELQKQHVELKCKHGL